MDIINHPTESGYHQLQQHIDTVIGKIGLQRTLCLLDSFIKNVSVSFKETDKVKLLTYYIVSLALETFELREDLFYVSNVTEYRDARMCCFHLIRKYTGETFAKTGIGFHCSERKVAYGNQITEERLSFPQAYQGFVLNYHQLESRLLEFIGKLN